MSHDQDDNANEKSKTANQARAIVVAGSQAIQKKQYEKWKEEGMIFNRFKPVILHRSLMKKVEADSLDIEDIRSILKTLIEKTLPISAFEEEVITRIELATEK